jgi:hypothetical protein
MQKPRAFGQEAVLGRDPFPSFLAFRESSRSDSYEEDERLLKKR